VLKKYLLSISMGVVAIVLILPPSGARRGTVVAQTIREPSRAMAARVLMGTIRSTNGKPMEGVTVSARELRKTFTTSVFTDQQGNYYFPMLDKGQYGIWAQAAGYEAGRAETALDPARETRRDFTLKPIADFSAQLSGAEWLEALPEDTVANRRMKEIFRHDCTYCHPPNFVLQNQFDRNGWSAILNRMERITQNGEMTREPLPHVHPFKEELIDYLTSVRSPSAPALKLKPLSRPTGDAARAVFTDYDLNEFAPGDEPVNGSNWAQGAPSWRAFRIGGAHDASVDLMGNSWVSSSGGNPNWSYAKIDSRTGEVTLFKAPMKNGAMPRTYEINTAPDGMLWMNMGGSIARVDPETNKLDVFSVEQGMRPVGDYVDIDGKGKIWGASNRGAIRFDPETNRFTEYISPSADKPGFRANGLAADGEGNGWWAEIGPGDILSKFGGTDLKTGKLREVTVPPPPEQKAAATEKDREVYFRTPHRLAADHRGSTLWAADLFGEEILGFDIPTQKTTYYKVPVAYAGAYDIAIDKQHVLWIMLRNADRVARFDPTSKKWTIYQLPVLGAECRNIYVDEYGDSGEVWMASWRTAKAIRMQLRTEQQLAAVRIKR